MILQQRSPSRVECRAEFWNGLWKERRKKLAEAGSTDCGSLWEDVRAAQRYARQVEDPEGGRERIQLILQDLTVPEGARILDIGAGPGCVTVPLARKGAEVTVVEPAEGMCQVLRERIQQDGFGNIRIIPKRWEDVTVEEIEGPFDIVLSSFALGMDDLQAAVEKMTAVCGGRVYLYWFVGETSWQQLRRRLWPALHGKELPPVPEEDVLYNLLYCLGYSVAVRRFSYSFVDRYTTLEDLVAGQKSAYRLITRELETQFLSLILPYLREDENGYWIPGYAEFAAYSWEIPKGRYA